VDSYGMKRRLTCILAADAVGYSGKMGEDEEGTVRILAAHRAIIDGIIAFHEGRIMHTAGDSVLAEFSSVVEAVRCAVEIQDALKTRNDALPENRRMLFRVGVNLGDVVVKNDDLLGDGVNVAARLESIAEPGGICISSSVYDQITGKLDLGFLDIGEQSLKNISRPIRVFRVSGTAGPARTAPPTTPAPAVRKSPRAVLIAVGTLAIAAVAAWQAGWMRFGPGDAGSPKTVTAPVAAPSPAPATSAATTTTVTPPETSGARTQGEAERLRAEAESLKRQAEAELARARSEAEASRASKTRTDAEAAAAKLRAQAETDAARIRADAEATVARARIDADAATRAANAELAKASQSAAKAEPARVDATSARAPATAETPAKVATTGLGSAGSFDGTWNVTIVCAASSDGALGYTFEFPAQVKDGFLRGDQGIEGNSSWLRLQGQIQPDGSATLNASGLTGDAKFSGGYGKGTPYGYLATARFEGSHGTGRRLAGRTCDLRFAKQ
jgi:class 3 adenylate cyclase/F0F1-type ATP synthase membrane subunit b/b'